MAGSTSSNGIVRLVSYVFLGRPTRNCKGRHEFVISYFVFTFIAGLKPAFFMAIIYYLFYVLVFFAIPAFAVLFLIKLYSNRLEKGVDVFNNSKDWWKTKFIESSKKLFPALRMTFFTFATAIIALSVCAILIYPLAKKYHSEERTHQLIHILQSTLRYNPTQLIN